MATSIPRLLLGFLLAPGIPVLVLYIINLQLVPRNDAEFGAVMFFLMAYIAALLVGIPAYCLARRLRVSALRGYALLGALAGLVFHALILISFAPPFSLAQAERLLLLTKNSGTGAIVAAAYAAASGALFWVIAVWPGRTGKL